MDARGIPEGMAVVAAQLTAPGGFFEVGIEEHDGAPLEVLTGRLPSLRAALEASEAFGDREYVIFADKDTRRVVTHAEHRRAVASVAQVLATEYGVGKGDRVAILAANCPEWIVTFWAAVSLGAIAVGLNGWWSATRSGTGWPTPTRRCWSPIGSASTASAARIRAFRRS